MINEGQKGSTELEMIRKHTLIDGDRDKQFPDDVYAYLIKSGVKPECIWVRTETILDGKVAGRLINKPFSEVFALNIEGMVKVVSIRLNKLCNSIFLTEYVGTIQKILR